MSEFARESVLASVNVGGGSRASLGGDLVTLTARLQELDRALKGVSGLIEKVLGDGHEEPHSETEQPQERFGGGAD